ncbi:MAG: RNA methyltransferase [Deltaproteobacteria bacterium HGW-Deltaproteobacteria-15]|jgi:putative N6-adenine-specific DNA methylase|nr:MAG: RNA methyltransferase [Deltaproteobacteria bacterium HGW-Deltaproteobacteria-15]
MTNAYEYQQTNRYFAQVPEGMEQLASEELSELNGRDISPAYRGVYFLADHATLYRANYRSRILSRILAPLISFRCHSTDYLYRKAREIEWSDFLDVDQSFAIFSNVSNSKISHSQFAAQRLKDAVVDHFRERSGRRPSVEREEPDLWISLHIESNRAVLSVDTSGGSLHRRGYRSMSLAAVMQETLAAAVVRLSAWDGSRPLYDPMCGAGTILCEALMLHCRIPAGYLRKRFGFERLPDFDGSLWEKTKKQDDAMIRDLPEGLIAGSDLSRKAVETSRTNLRNLPSGDRVLLYTKDFRELAVLEERVIVCDPPYGVRLQGKENLPGLYKELGDFLKRKCRGSTAFIYFGNRDLIRHVGLKPSWKVPLLSGGLDGRLAKYELY